MPTGYITIDMIEPDSLHFDDPALAAESDDAPLAYYNKLAMVYAQTRHGNTEVKPADADAPAAEPATWTTEDHDFLTPDFG